MEKTLGSDCHKALITFLIERREAVGMTEARLAERLGEYRSFMARLESEQLWVDVVEFIELGSILEFDPAAAVAHFARFR